MRIDRDHDEAGFTLVELIITMSLLTIVSIMMFSFLTSATSITGRATRDGEVEKSAQFALRTATEEIRGASSIATCNSNTISAASDGVSPTLSPLFEKCISFNVVRTTSTSLACPKTEYVFALVGTTLVQNRTQFDGSCAAIPSSVVKRRKLLENVVNTGAQPIFRYYRDDGSEISVPSQNSDVPGAAAIKMNLQVRYQINAPVVSFTSILSPRNNIG